MTKGLDSVRVENINSGRTEQRESIISSDSEESKSPSKFTNPAAVVSKWWSAIVGSSGSQVGRPSLPSPPSPPSPSSPPSQAGVEVSLLFVDY